MRLIRCFLGLFMTPPASSFRWILGVSLVVLVGWACSDEPEGPLTPPPPPAPQPPPDVPPVLVGSWGELGAGPGQFRNLTAIKIDADDVVYLTDWETVRVQRFQPDGTFLGEWPVEIPTRLSAVPLSRGPQDMTIAPNGDIYVLLEDGDTWWIARFLPDGTYLFAVALEKGPATEQVEFAPAIAVDADGNLYVADYFEDRIQKLDSLGRFLGVWTGGDDRITQPRGLGWGPNGTLFAMERQLQVYEFDADGAVMNLWSLNHHAPEAMGVDAFGNVYTSSQRRNTIERSTPDGAHIEWQDVALGGIAVASDGTVLVGHSGSVAVYRYAD